MTNKSPIFPFQQSQHFSDYGFDPQIHYFQVLEEARKHKQRETTTSSFRLSSSSSIVDNLHFKLQKPISKDNDTSKKIKKTRQRWWRHAFHFFKRKQRTNKCDNNVYSGTTSSTSVRAFSGPVYFTDTATAPYHRTSTSSRPSSGPLARGDFDISIPYISLTELNMDHAHTMPMPIYLVT